MKTDKKTKKSDKKSRKTDKKAKREIDETDIDWSDLPFGKDKLVVVVNDTRLKFKMEVCLPLC